MWNSIHPDVRCVPDAEPRPAYCPHDFTKVQLIPADKAYCIAGEVDRADKLYLAIELAQPDT